MKPSNVKRFWSYVDKSSGSEGCWIWIGGMGGSYGSCNWGGQSRRVHRVSYQISFGPIPKGMCVSHKCGNKLCVNPTHLFLDTFQGVGKRSAQKRLGDPIKRFWSQVDKSIGPEDCWKWIGSVHTRGYGRVTWCGQSCHAHRVSWRIAFGPIPEGKHVLHKCDNKLCVNPKHLWIGTNADNMKDRDAKGRQPRGETSGAAKLTEERVKEIRRLAAKGILQKEISRKLCVPKSTVSQIVTRRRWKHIP